MGSLRWIVLGVMLPAFGYMVETDVAREPSDLEVPKFHKGNHLEDFPYKMRKHIASRKTWVQQARPRTSMSIFWKKYVSDSALEAASKGDIKNFIKLVKKKNGNITAPRLRALYAAALNDAAHDPKRLSVVKRLNPFMARQEASFLQNMYKQVAPLRHKPLDLRHEKAGAETKISLSQPTRYLDKSRSDGLKVKQNVTNPKSVPKIIPKDKPPVHNKERNKDEEYNDWRDVPVDEPVNSLNEDNWLNVSVNQDVNSEEQDRNLNSEEQDRNLLNSLEKELSSYSVQHHALSSYSQPPTVVWQPPAYDQVPLVQPVQSQPVVNRAPAPVQHQPVSVYQPPVIEQAPPVEQPAPVQQPAQPVQQPVFVPQIVRVEPPVEQPAQPVFAPKRLVVEQEPVDKQPAVIEPKPLVVQPPKFDPQQLPPLAPVLDENLNPALQQGMIETILDKFNKEENSLNSLFQEDSYRFSISFAGYYIMNKFIKHYGTISHKIIKEIFGDYFKIPTVKDPTMQKKLINEMLDYINNKDDSRLNYLKESMMQYIMPIAEKLRSVQVTKKDWHVLANSKHLIIDSQKYRNLIWQMGDLKFQADTIFHSLAPDGIITDDPRDILSILNPDIDPKLFY